MSSIQLNLLGPAQISRDGVAVPPITSPKIVALLGYLVVEHQQSHSREVLAELLWPGQMTGRQNLRQSFSRLQKVLDQPAAAPPLFHSTRQEIAFNSAAGAQVDVMDFTQALAWARSHGHNSLDQCPTCAQLLQSAVQRYRGALLDGLSADSADFDEWLLARRAWLEQEALWALNGLAQYALAQTDSGQALAFARRQIAIDPLAEAAHQQIIQALLLDGRRGEAQSHYDELAELLAAELNVRPATATTALLMAERSLSTPSRPAQTNRSHGRRRTHRLPQQFTPFIGRQEMLALLSDRLAEDACRLLTLVGPGGVGKTRLAIEAARRAMEGEGEVCFIDLTALDGAAELPTALAAALELVLPPHAQTGSERQEALLHLLAERELLLVLDNYEHLLPNTAMITGLLQGTKHLRLLVTSRLPLHLRAEWLVDVDGLPVPSADAPAEEISGEKYAGLALFAQTAARVRHDFAPSPQGWELVAHICRLLQGAPLALELAAARLRELPLEALAGAIEQDLDFLSTAMADVPERHRSLRAVIDHSWQLLPATLQAVFARLSVFRGGFSPEAAQHIADASPADLEQLALHSLLRRVDADRFALHESLRQYTAEKLAAVSAVQGEIQRRHAAYYLALLADQEKRLFGLDVPGSLKALRLDYSNVRTAWAWATRHEQIRLIERSLNAAYSFYNAAGLVQEGREAIEQALAALPDEPTQPLLKARLLAKLARFCNVQGQYEQAISAAQTASQGLPSADHTGHPQAEAVAAEAWLQWGRAALHQGKYGEAEGPLEEALGMARSAGDARLEAEVHLNLGTIHNMQNAFALANAHDREALRLAQASGDRHSEGIALNNMGSVADFQGDYSNAAAYFSQARAVFDAIGYRRGSAAALSNLGAASAWLGELEQAVDCHTEGVQVSRELGDIDGEAWALMALGAVLTHLGRLEEARIHLQNALELNRQDGTSAVEAWSLVHLAQVEFAAGLLDEAEELAGRGYPLALELGDELTAATAQIVQGDVALRRGDFVLAERLYAGALAVNQRLEHRAGEMRVLACQARLALAQNDPHQARSLAEDALALDGPAKLLLDRAPLLAVCGRALAQLGETAQALEVLQEALSLHRKMGQWHLAAALEEALAGLSGDVL
ncbi:MAG: tetratricopeptide repeat protein [Caldilineaceae bacterium]|nr:tetratricopeptide repeat protein [Caldilineaceae bacterium]